MSRTKGAIGRRRESESVLRYATTSEKGRGQKTLLLRKGELTFEGWALARALSMLSSNPANIICEGDTFMSVGGSGSLVWASIRGHQRR